nr:hypothetical protein [Tanacetum cinerariifolium]
MSKCKGLYYYVPGKSLDDGFRVIKCDLDIYRFLDHAVSNGGRISLYIDHYDEDLTNFIKEDNLIDIIVDVDTDHEHGDDDEDDDDDVTTLNQTSNDHFLSLLCCDNVSSDG